MSERKVGLLLFFLTLALYLSLPNRNYSYDSVSYAWFIRSGYMLFHPHHLLYNPLGFLILRGLSSSGIQASPMAIMQVINSLVGALGVLLFFGIVHRLSEDRFISITFSLLLAFSFAYWYQSIENEVHIIPLVRLLYILSQMVSISLGDSQLTHSSLLRMGVVGSFAVLFHQLHLLFIPVAGFFIGNEVRQLRRGLRLFLWFWLPMPSWLGVRTSSLLGSLEPCLIGAAFSVGPPSTPRPIPEG